MSLSTSVKRVALVTGSGKKRVGWHVADALAGRGYDVAVHYPVVFILPFDRSAGFSAGNQLVSRQ